MEDLRKAISTSLRNIADELTDSDAPGASRVKRELYEVAARYADGTNTPKDADTVVRLHAWVAALTAGFARTEDRNDA
jgi:hypothetical protein